MSALIRTLRDADLRLEELTAGEVDSVSDRQGQSYLLRHAQDEFRAAEAARQAAILNVLPANIALLDPQGEIVSVNEAWRRFGRDNGLADRDYGLGRNYLKICESVSGLDCANARFAAEGIRAVLQGTQQVFSLEYSCDTSTVQRWFLLKVSALAEGNMHGAVVMHLDVTEQRRGAESLQRFTAGMDATADSICLIDRSSMRFVHVNDAGCRMHGRTREQLLAQGPAEILGRSRLEMEQEYDLLIARREPERPFEIFRQDADGSPVWVEVRRHVNESAGRWTIVVLVRDITERKRAEKRIQQLNRLHAVLSSINGLIVHARNREELYEQACRIAVQTGAFRMAWIGVIDPKTLTSKLVASHGGEQSYLDKVAFTLREGAADSETPGSRVLRDSQPVVCNDIASDSSLAAVRDELLAQGHKSAAFFPLALAGRTEAVWALFSEETAVFDDEEMRLLNELAGDMSFALDHIAKEDKLRYLAYYDELTALANRASFLERAGQHIASARAAAHGAAMLLIDVEGLKNINYCLGRAAGDQLLRSVAKWLRRHLGDFNLLARVGGDQFAVMLPEVTDRTAMIERLEKAIQAFLVHPFYLRGVLYRIGAKAGVALFPEDGRDADTLLSHVDAALKESKARGSRYLCYSPMMTASVAAKLTLENQLRQALGNHEFVLHYQPKLNLISGKIMGAEALIRWNDPRTGLVPPGRFIPILEESGMIFDVGRWALRQAIDDYLRWRQAGLQAVRIAVNVSPLQLRHRDFVAHIAEVIGIDPHAPAGLELEITEGVLMEDVKQSVAGLRQVRALGVQVAIDDFGTGFSSLSYLSKLPVDSLKIDRSFVSDMSATPEGLALVSTIINLAHSFKLNVVAEGVELEEQSRLLRLLGCDEVQGFLFGKPVPCDIFEAHYLMSASGAPAPAAQGHEAAIEI